MSNLKEVAESMKKSIAPDDLSAKAIDLVVNKKTGETRKYVLVSDRVVYFNENYPNGSIQTQLLSEIKDDMVVIKAVVIPDVANPNRFFTGYSQAVWGDGYINQSAALENCETSAVGRALAFLGIGVIDSIASIDEINKAQLQKPYQPPVKKAEPPKMPREFNAELKSRFLKKVSELKPQCPPLDWERLITDFGYPEEISDFDDSVMFVNMLTKAVERAKKNNE